MITKVHFALMLSVEVGASLIHCQSHHSEPQADKEGIICKVAYQHGRGERECAEIYIVLTYLPFSEIGSNIPTS